MCDSIRIRNDNNVLGAKKEGRLQAYGGPIHPELLQIYNETSKGLVNVLLFTNDCRNFNTTAIRVSLKTKLNRLACG